MSNLLTKDEVFAEPCKAGQGTNTCRYIAFAAREGFFCAKHEAGLRRQIDERVAALLVTARGDNCEGKRA